MEIRGNERYKEGTSYSNHGTIIQREREVEVERVRGRECESERGRESKSKEGQI